MSGLHSLSWISFFKYLPSPSSTLLPQHRGQFLMLWKTLCKFQIPCLSCFVLLSRKLYLFNLYDDNFLESLISSHAINFLIPVLVIFTAKYVAILGKAKQPTKTDRDGKIKVSELHMWKDTNPIPLLSSKNLVYLLWLGSKHSTRHRTCDGPEKTGSERADKMRCSHTGKGFYLLLEAAISFYIIHEQDTMWEPTLCPKIFCFAQWAEVTEPHWPCLGCLWEKSL